MTNYLDPAELTASHRIAVEMCERAMLEADYHMNVSEVRGVVSVKDGSHVRNREDSDRCANCGKFALYGETDRNWQESGYSKMDAICYSIADFIIELAVTYNDGDKGHTLWGVEIEGKPSLWAN